MIQKLTGRYQKHIAVLLFFIFYSEMLGGLYAAGRSFNAITDHSHRVSNYFLFDQPIEKNIPATHNDQPTIKIGESNLSSIDKNDKVENSVDIGGPGQPEMSSFKSVGADNMVNLFTGDFSYNIHLLDVGGYPVNIFYNAGATMDQEASWVGLGWNINPGTISRNMRGLPDDYNGVDSITKVQSIKHDLTIGVSGAKGIEAFGLPGLSLNANIGMFYNNRRGFGLEAGVKGDYKIHHFIAKQAGDEKTLKDTGDIKLIGGINLNSQNGMTFNGGFSIFKHDLEKDVRSSLSTSINFSSRQGLTDISISGEIDKYKKDEENKKEDLIFYGPHATSINFARSSFMPSIRMPLTVSNQFYKVKLGKEQTGLFKEAEIGGYVMESKIANADTLQKKPAYGYMYYEKGNNDKNAMLDFNRLNDGVYTYKTPVISVPVYTYDVFSINGEGTGGSFRGYRGNMGYVRDNDTRSKNGSFHITLDLGAGKIFHGGTELGGIYSPSFVNEWKIGNALRKSAAFNETDSIYQSFYFKNPGETAIIDGDYYSRMGADSLIRPYLGDIQSATPYLKSSFQVMNSERKVERTIPLALNNTSRKVRDKRTQVITYLTALDAERVGLDKYIYSYTENLFLPGSCDNAAVKTKIARYNRYDPTFYRKENHLSEIDVLESDGRRYVYGIPVYQVMQKEVTFTTDNSPNGNQLVSYTPGQENSTNNTAGRDGFYQSETMKGYAHSFLLTAILSPDYVDVKDDGISDDDLGTAVKFNYSRVNKQRSSLLGANYWRNFKWRLPAEVNKANFNEGLKADDRDNKGLYTYGEKELWYLHSIESKNMVATFYVSERNDGRQVAGENGGLSGAIGQKKLDKINLYTKADYLKYGSNAKPIKTVHFRYSYKLCKNFNLNNSGQYETSGKLTLDSLWFTYNGNTNQARNKYRFKYTDVNPDYKSTENDRWGNYKNHLQNPEFLPNNDYPYTIQDATQSNSNAAAWNLEKILLPGGALIKVQYEADDYAFVQDKRACQMTQILGFGKLASSTPSNKLYTLNLNLAPGTPAGSMDHRFVFFYSSQPLTSKADIREKYLKDFNQLLLKLWVLMPKGNIGADPAYEPVVVYGAIKDYNVVAGNPNRFYIELEETKKGGSPIMETVIQFLKDHLPHRAYPGYEVTGDGFFVQVIRSVLGMISAFTQGVMGFEKNLKASGKCKEVLLSNSFARLNSPAFKKIGGGHRVKKITISDNWHTMTNRTSQFGAEYGQEYNYTTTEEVNGQKITISSGVASYEPGVGNEENPFREVLKYSVGQFLGPTSHENIELPFAETFFPSPMIGYSKVTVKSIHNKDNKNIKSGIGLQQTEFYTTRDFPVIDEFTDFDNSSRHHHRPNFIEQVFNFNKRDYMTLTQGFRIVLNDMNGKMKSQTSYAENDLVTPINYTANFYRLIPRGDRKFKLDNKLPVISGPDGKITDKIVGKDIEVMNDFREHFSYTYAANIPLNVDYFQAGAIPIIVPTIFRLAFRNESLYRSATTLKIVNEYGILDSVVNIDKGSVVGTKNLVYDAESGNVLVSRTNNEFNKPVYQFSYPAWWAQTGMQPAYKNIDLTYKGVYFKNGRIQNAEQVKFNWKYIESGDELYVVPFDSKPVSETDACIGVGYPTTLPVSNEYRIWALDIQKDLRNSEKDFIFIDRYGNPYNANNVTLRIIRSGKRNLTGASVGSIVSLASPIYTDINGQRSIVIDNNTDVINASAAEFKERWRTNDMFYSVDTVLRTVKQATIHPTTVYVKYTDTELPNTQSFGEYYNRGTRYYDNIQNPSYFMTEYFDKNATFGGGREFRQKSWVLFDFPSNVFNSSTKIVSANLLLTAHTANHPITINKNESPNAPFYTVDNHTFQNPHISTPAHKNDFLITRMFSAWPDANSFSSWQYLYKFYPMMTDFNVKAVTGTPPPLSFAPYNIDVTRVVEGMLKDKFDLSKNYATALRINLIQENANGLAPARVCFAGEYVGKNYPPRILVNYYQCNENDPVVYQGGVSGAPVTPPEGYAYCVSDVVGKMCFSVFTRKQMNPYVEGVLGNWRGWRSYVYYGERRESDPAAATDIRKDGIIKNYESYWTLNELLLGKTGSTKWVWNAEITQYNRKGAELENHDPLGRYNAGIYGYQESLPIAVINNSRLRLSAFDGFEDYFYKDDPCEPFCKPSKRHFTTGISTTQLDSTESHTGRYSFKINAATNYQFKVNVTDNDEEANPDVRIKLNKIPYESAVVVNPKGVGLKGYYYNNTTFTAPYQNTREDAYVSFVIRSKNNNACKNDSDPMPAGVNCGHISVKWLGKVQVTATGNYEFAASWANDICKIYINNNLVCNGVYVNGNYTQTITPVYLTAGTLHDIRVEYVQVDNVGEINMVWKTPGATTFTTIDPKYLYPEGKESLANGTTVTQTIYCEKPDTIQAIAHHLIDSFNLIPGKKMVASVWVKKGGQDCKCTAYTNIGLMVRDAAGGDVSFVAKERIIEGWQQYEAIFTVPSDKPQVKLEFQAPNDVAIYVDDLRVHPFNGNMKSFVYDPVTLRLSAELDENNFASFYEYDDEGGLIRVKKETRAGIKTITETRSAIQRKIIDF